MKFKGAITLTICLSLYAGIAEAQVADHLECYKIKDSAQKASYVADLHGLAVEPGCSITVPAKLLCVDTTKTNVQPAAPIDGDGAEQSRVLCYKVKCPKQPLPSVAWTDQFGARPLAVAGSKYVCAPDLAPETTTTTVTTTTTLSSSFQYIFVTQHTFDGNLGGIAGGDFKCQDAAVSAGLPGTYRAFLSGTGISAPSRFAAVAGELRLTDGVTVVANDVADLVANGPDVAISKDEFQTIVPGRRVWTATNFDGTYYGQNCNISGGGDWATTSSRTLAGIADSTSGWTSGAGVQPCASLFSLYCIQLD